MVRIFILAICLFGMTIALPSYEIKERNTEKKTFPLNILKNEEKKEFITALKDLLQAKCNKQTKSDKREEGGELDGSVGDKSGGDEESGKNEGEEGGEKTNGGEGEKTNGGEGESTNGGEGESTTGGEEGGEGESTNGGEGESTTGGEGEGGEEEGGDGDGGEGESTNGGEAEGGEGENTNGGEGGGGEGEHTNSGEEGNDHGGEDENSSGIWGNCGYGVFQCQNGKCVNVDEICNGFPSCSKGEDELFCSDYFGMLYNYTKKTVKRSTGVKIDDKTLRAKVYKEVTDRYAKAAVGKSKLRKLVLDKKMGRKEGNIKDLLVRKINERQQKRKNIANNK